MKNFFLTLIVFLVFTITGNSQESIGKAKYNVNMHCESCKNKIENTLKNTIGVKIVEADLFKLQVVVEYNKDEIDKDQIAQKIRDLGYEVKEVGKIRKKTKKVKEEKYTTDDHLDHNHQ